MDHMQHRYEPTLDGIDSTIEQSLEALSSGRDLPTFLPTHGDDVDFSTYLIAGTTDQRPSSATTNDRDLELNAARIQPDLSFALEPMPRHRTATTTLNTSNTRNTSTVHRQRPHLAPELRYALGYLWDTYPEMRQVRGEFSRHALFFNTTRSDMYLKDPAFGYVPPLIKDRDLKWELEIRAFDVTDALWTEARAIGETGVLQKIKRRLRTSKTKCSVKWDQEDKKTTSAGSVGQNIALSTTGVSSMSMTSGNAGDKLNAPLNQRRIDATTRLNGSLLKRKLSGSALYGDTTNEDSMTKRLRASKEGTAIYGYAPAQLPSVGIDQAMSHLTQATLPLVLKALPKLVLGDLVKTLHVAYPGATQGQICNALYQYPNDFMGAILFLENRLISAPPHEIDLLASPLSPAGRGWRKIKALAAVAEADAQLNMLHRSFVFHQADIGHLDVSKLGDGGFVHHDDPIFLRGGLLHRIKLIDNLTETEEIIDAMLCESDKCTACGPALPHSGSFADFGSGTARVRVVDLTLQTFSQVGRNDCLVFDPLSGFRSGGGLDAWTAQRYLAQGVVCWDGVMRRAWTN